MESSTKLRFRNSYLIITEGKFGQSIERKDYVLGII